MEIINSRKTKVQSWYLDMGMIQRYWGNDRVYHHTAPISMNYALREALALVVEEGLEARHARHALNGRRPQGGPGRDGHWHRHRPRGTSLPQLTCVRIPDGVDDVAVRKRLLKDWGIEIGGGLGPLKGQGLAGRPDGLRLAAGNVTLLLAALETCLRDLGQALEPGAALAAASEVYSRTGQPAMA